MIYVLLAKPVYESRAVVKIGQVGSVGPVEEVAVLGQRLSAEHPALTAVEHGSGEAQNVLTLIVTADDRETAREDINTIVDKLLEEHRSRFHAMQTPLRQRRDALGIRLADYRQQLNELDIQVSRLRSEQPVQAAVLMIEKGNVTRAIPELEDKLAELEQALGEPQTVRTRVLGEPTTTETPIKPRSALIITLSIVSGLILGMVAAFLAKLIARARTPAAGKEM
ncbi:hypothetical protein [Thiohalophilus sp.]|uniref:hypothetical protein n=1 Tax=Thiohalophilus sp. TaxID=3028392 RepID=UPI002ACDB5AA|nr:hypothetical protein [Thiohalophilus sp.]MDZ7662784.1 hypothetical protein [Thiohalophilus sp.]